MKHGKSGRKFGRVTKKRKALLRDLALSLVMNRKITITQARAKSLRPYVEKLITRSKNADLATFKTMVSRIGLQAARKLTKDIGPEFTGRNGGYTRIRNMPPRLSDGAKMAVIELVS